MSKADRLALQGVSLGMMGVILALMDVHPYVPIFYYAMAGLFMMAVVLYETWRGE